jgi:DNA-binding transcriptional MerR regulator/quercetin dioxygenase-like cupin family protein
MSEPASRDGVYISQAAELVGASPAQIRAWEQQGLVSPARSESGYRLYSFSDIERLRRIRRLMLSEGIRPRSLKQLLDSESENGAPRARVAAESSVTPALGARVRALRSGRGTSLRELASAAGLSPSYLSAIERSTSSPSVAALQKIAAALGSNLVNMLSDRPGSDAGLVVRRGERRKLPLEIDGVVIEQLAGVHTQLESLLFRVEPGAGSVDSYSHVGEEMLYVISGTFEITLDEQESYALEAEDSIAFDSLRPHRWRNPGAEPAIVFWVNTPPTF